MADAIPIRNLYHLLLYAWDMLEMREIVSAEALDRHDVTQLLARMLAAGLHTQWRRGIAHGYVEFAEEAPTLRGRIDFGESIRRQSFRRGVAVCHADEWSADILPNRLIRATLDRLLSWRLLEKERSAELRTLREPLLGVRVIPPRPRDFRACRFNSHQRLYRFILHVCELLHLRLLPERAVSPWRVRDFFQDEERMPKLFELFVRRFYQRHLPGAKVGATQIGWDVICHDDESRMGLPMMKTDVVMEWPDRKIILDCKYYRAAFAQNYGVEKLHADNLYQLYAYMRNQAAQPGWQHVEGVLLYPAGQRHFNLRYTFGNHRVRVVSLNLSRSWQEIESALLDAVTAQGEWKEVVCSD